MGDLRLIGELALRKYPLGAEPSPALLDVAVARHLDELAAAHANFVAGGLEGSLVDMALRGFADSTLQKISRDAVSYRVAATLGDAQIRDTMRTLWSEHSARTYDYVCAATEAAPRQDQLDALLKHLLANQDDIGAAMASLYNDNALGAAVATLLKEHIAIAGKLVAALRIGSNEAPTLWNQWLKNADDIAAALNRVNPRHWLLQVLRSHLREHLATTAKEVTLRIEPNYLQAAVQYRQVVLVQVRAMAAVLADGIVAQRADQRGEVDERRWGPGTTRA